MKLIDKTPLLNEKGEIGFIQRIQGSLRYGFDWYPELEAQKFVLTQLNRGLAKGNTVIRNHTLGASGIILPLALIGPAGIFALLVTNLRGTFQAKGDSWGTLSETSFQPARINLLSRTERLAKALQVYVERLGITLPQPVEPILLTANPGMHVESVRPIVNVVMADAVERWAASLGKSSPVFTVESAFEIADRIVNPNSAQQAAEGVEIPAETGDSSDAFSMDSQTTKTKRVMGMTIPQLALLGGMFLFEICLIIGFGLIIFSNS